ncbi:MAG: hypothetical protein ACE5F9_06070 [Phycisphaerae bacterium]
MRNSEPVLITCRCPDAACHGRVRTVLSDVASLELACPHCGGRVHVAVDAALVETRSIGRCPACGGDEFFVRKDFPQALGLALVVVFGLTASVFYYFNHVLATFGTLGSLVVVDAIIYLFVGRVTVCYRCRAEFRRVAYNADHMGFDLATSEKYA